MVQEAFQADWVMTVDVHWVHQSFASEVYLLPLVGDHFAIRVEPEVLGQSFPAWVPRPMGDVQPFVD